QRRGRRLPPHDRPGTVGLCPRRAGLADEHLQGRRRHLTMRLIASYVPCGWIHCDIPWEIRLDPPAGDTLPQAWRRVDDRVEAVPLLPRAAQGTALRGRIDHI